jgi:AmmeMemoRadiSam system protein A
MNKYISLAKKAVENYIKNGKKISASKNFEDKKAGVFVSIHTISGNLRGCVGTILPTKDNLAQEIISNAIAAATRDNRFEKVSKEELSDLKYKVDILTEPEPINSSSALEPKRYGVIVKTEDGRCGVLLPDLPDIDNPEIQVGIVCEKAGIRSNEKKYLYRFEVKRFE